MRFSVEAPVHVIGVEGDVTFVEHGVLGNTDIDEGQFHAGQNVLDPTDVDVAVDLVGLVGVLGHRVLDHGATFERGDMSAVARRVHGHEVATLGARSTLAAATPSAPDPVGRRRRHRPRGPTLPPGRPSFVAATRFVRSDRFDSSNSRGQRAVRGYPGPNGLDHRVVDDSLRPEVADADVAGARGRGVLRRRSGIAYLWWRVECRQFED